MSILYHKIIDTNSANYIIPYYRNSEIDYTKKFIDLESAAKEHNKNIQSLDIYRINKKYDNSVSLRGSFSIYNLPIRFDFSTSLVVFDHLFEILDNHIDRIFKIDIDNVNTFLAYVTKNVSIVQLSSFIKFTNTFNLKEFNNFDFINVNFKESQIKIHYNLLRNSFELNKSTKQLHQFKSYGRTNYSYEQQISANMAYIENDHDAGVFFNIIEFCIHKLNKKKHEQFKIAFEKALLS